MSKNIVYNIFFLCLLATSAHSQPDDDMLEHSVKPIYDKAIELNNKKNYLEAFGLITTAANNLDAILASENIKPMTLEDWQFAMYYWPIKKSQAEIAYMLGNYTLMGHVAKRLRKDLEQSAESHNHKDWLADYYADLAKIDGDTHYLTENYLAADSAYLKALRLKGEQIEYDFGFFFSIHGDFAQLYYKMGRYAEALAQLDIILQHHQFRETTRAADVWGIEDKRMEINSQRAICLARLGFYEDALKEIEVVCAYYKKKEEKRSYAESLREKAKILMLQYDATGKYSPRASAYYQEYLSISKNFIDNHFIHMSESEREQYWMAEQPFVTDCFRLEEKAPALLYDAALYSKAVLLQLGRDFKENMTLAERKRALASIRITWKQVRDKLPTSGCAIEFIVYEKHGKHHIGALVINKKSNQPEFVPIDSVTAISNYTIFDGLSVKDVFANTTNMGYINSLYNDSSLQQIIWNEELVKAIGKNKTVYFSPDGIFHQLAIEYMIPKTLEGKQLFRLTTTRLLAQEKRSIRTDKMFICGGIDYHLSADDAQGGNDQLAYSQLAAPYFTLNSLDGSAKETDSIACIRQEYYGDKFLRADSITEFVLNQIMGKYHIVHLSTHGIFSDVATIGTDIYPSSTDTQLSRSCLFLSGSEKNLRDNTFDASKHDGVLSARELAKMDLHDVDLAVLSACMSGLGYITPDGVFGLQRGLKTAGVCTLISSLWSINDGASCYFIIQLYKNLESGMSLHKAFWSARESLMNYEETYGDVEPATDKKTQGAMDRIRNRRFSYLKYNQPYYYNAFILIDGLE